MRMKVLHARNTYFSMRMKVLHDWYLSALFGIVTKIKRMIAAAEPGSVN